MVIKKGFTLVELLAVIAILAILVIIAMPNVLKRFNAAKKSTFETEVRRLIEEAGSEYVEDMMFSTSTKLYDSKSNPLDMSGNELDYSLYMDTKGNITCLQVNNGSYQFTYSGDGITKSSEINVIDKEEGFTPNCDSSTSLLSENKICFFWLHKMERSEESKATNFEEYTFNVNRITEKDNFLFLDIPESEKDSTLIELSNYYFNNISSYSYLDIVYMDSDTLKKFPILISKTSECDTNKSIYENCFVIKQSNSYSRRFYKLKDDGIYYYDNVTNEESTIKNSTQGCYGFAEK